MKVEVGDIGIGYEETGSGKPLVLIMGFTGTIESWVPTFVEPLAAKSRVIMFDNRGTGGTSVGTKPFTIGQFAEDTAGLLRTLGLDKSDVLGWSMGGFVALELATRYPDLVGDLVLVSSCCGGGETIPIDPRIMDEIADMSGTTRDVISRHLKVMFPAKWLEDNAETVEELLSLPAVFPPEDVIDKQATAIRDWRGTWDLLPGIESRALMLCGTEDIVVDPKNSAMMAERFPRGELALLEECGHGAIFQEPERSTAIIGDFLF